MSLSSTLLLAILISITVVFCLPEYLRNEKENPHFIGSINNPEYVGHGEVTNIESFSCYDSEVIGDSKVFFLSGDKLYSTKIGNEDSGELINVHSYINPKNRNEVVTSISDKGDNKNIKVPLLLRCEGKEKEVVGLNLPIKTGLEVVAYNDLCGDGFTVDRDINGARNILLKNLTR